MTKNATRSAPNAVSLEGFVDAGLGTVTILSEEMHRPDKTVSMPSMIMVFHVTNRAMLQGLESKDVVEFEAARLSAMPS